MATPFFERCRGLSSREIAERLGIPLVKRGSRYWTKCLFHPERTASLLFNEDGSWHCFSCNRHGNAVSFYAGALSISDYRAAKQLASGIACPPMNLPLSAEAEKSRQAKHLSVIINTWVTEEYRKACLTLDRATFIVELVTDLYNLAASADQPFDPPSGLYYWVSVAAHARTRIEELTDDDPYALLMLMQREGHYDTSAQVF